MSKLLAALQQIDSRPAAQVESPPVADDLVSASIATDEPAEIASAVAVPDEIESTAEPSDESAAAADETAELAAMEARGTAGALQTIAEMNLLLAEALAAQQTELADREAHQDEVEHIPHPSPAIETPVDAPKAVAVSRELCELLEQLLAAFKTSLPLVATFAGAGPESADSFWLMPLAIAYTQQNVGRVLIVEADGAASRWPAQLGMAVDSGFVDLLKSRAARFDCVYPTAAPRVDLLPRGTGDWSNNEAAGERLQELFAELKADYSLVLIAAGDATQSAAAAVSKLSDGVVLVVGLNATARSAAQRAKAALEAAGARIVGAVIRG